MRDVRLDNRLGDMQAAAISALVNPRATSVSTSRSRSVSSTNVLIV
jgi:hypothetical protein